MNPDSDYVLTLIAQGYLLDTLEDRYIRLENPKYQPDNGEDPLIVFDIYNWEYD